MTLGGAALVEASLDVGVGVASEPPVIDVDVHAFSLIERV